MEPPDPKRLLGQLRISDFDKRPPPLGAPLLNATTALRPGERVGERFVIEGILGQGGMGVVLEARDSASDRLVALKFVLARHDNEQLRARLMLEAELVARVRHPGVLRIHSVEEHEGLPFLVYERIEGARTLAEALPELDEEERLTILERVARAVGAAHAAGVVHRDLKPENVLLDLDGRPSLIDFGIALDLNSEERLTQTGGVVGSPLYMAPEQIRGDRDQIGPATDVWALGVLLYELLTDEPPHLGANPAELLGHMHSTPIPAQAELPPALASVLRGALCVDPSRRYPDGSAFAAALATSRRPVHSGASLGPVIGAALFLLLAVTVAAALQSPADPPQAAPQTSTAPTASTATTGPGGEDSPRPPWEGRYPGALDAVFVDETHLAIVYPNHVLRVDLETGRTEDLTLPQRIRKARGRVLLSQTSVFLATRDWRAVRLRVAPGATNNPRGRTGELSRTGTQLAYSNENHVRVLDLASGEVRLERSHSEPIRRIAVSETHVAVLGNWDLAWWEIETGHRVAHLERAEAESIDLDPRGRELLVGFEVGPMAAYDLATGKKLRRYEDPAPTGMAQMARGAHTGRVSEVRFLEDGERLISANESRTYGGDVAVWERTGRQLLRTEMTHRGFMRLNLSPSGRAFSVLNTSRGRVWVRAIPRR